MEQVMVNRRTIAGFLCAIVIGALIPAGISFFRGEIVEKSGVEIENRQQNSNFVVAPEVSPAEIYDFSEIMINAVLESDIDTGSRVSEYLGYSYTDLYELSHILAQEVGSDWIPDWVILAAGEVILNRVQSEHYPNTIYGVVHDPGQYSGASDAGFYEIQPTERVVRLASSLLDGTGRVFNNSAVVFQAEFPQGSSCVVAYYDMTLGTTTYFCEW